MDKNVQDSGTQSMTALMPRPLFLCIHVAFIEFQVLGNVISQERSPHAIITTTTTTSCS